MAARCSLGLVALLTFFSGVAAARDYDAAHAYKGKVPLAHTALLFAEEVDNPHVEMAYVTDVDETSMVNIWWGRPAFSVRVLPGSHRFTVRAVWNLRFGGLNGVSTGTEQYLRFEVPDMQPLHVYVIHYRKQADGVIASVEDLGERAEHHPKLAIPPKF
jgi:hypothetical protein